MSDDRQSGAFLTGAQRGLWFAAIWLFVEGLYLSFRLVEVPAWSAPLNVGVGVGVAILFGLLTGLASWCWSRLNHVPDPMAWLVRRVADFFITDSADDGARRSAWLVTAPLLVVVWFGVGLAVGSRVLGTVKTTVLAVILICGVQFVLAVGLAGLAAVVAFPLTRTFEALGVVSPRLTLGAVALLGGAGFVAAWFVFPDVLPHLPWHFVLGPALGLATVAAVEGPVAERRRPALGAALAVLLVAGIGTFLLPVSLSEGRRVFIEQPSVAGATYSLIHRALDTDGDGSIAFYGENDCGPNDPDIGPHQQEIVGNGIDENCSGADLEVDLAEFGTGKTAHPRPTGIAKRPHVVLVTTDALSHHHTTFGGYHRNTTPNLAAWAERSTVFESAFSLSSSTRLSFPGIVTGMFNSMVKLKNRRVHPYHYAKSVPTIATTLKGKGYRTVHVPGDDYFLGRRWGGYTNGFDVVDPSAYREAKDRIHTAPEVTDRGIAEIERHAASGEPLFLWLHYYDHHEPNRLPDGENPFEADSALDKYDNELHFADHHWGRLFDAIEKRWDREEYLLVFTADHGEVFDEKHPRGRRHDYTLDTQVLHVPLIIGGPTRAARVDGLVSHADIIATIANVVGARPHPRWIGESLVPVLFDGKPVEKDVVYSVFYTPEAVKRGQDGFSKIGVRTTDYYYWEDRPKDARLFIDWREDPSEASDLSGEYPELFESYRYVAARKLEWLRREERGLTRFARKKKPKKKANEKRRRK